MVARRRPRCTVRAMMMLLFRALPLLALTYALATGNSDLAVFLIARENNASATGTRYSPSFMAAQYAYLRALVKVKRAAR